MSQFPRTTALLMTALIIVLIRESGVWVMERLGHAELGNFCGLFALLAILILIRRHGTLPEWLLHSNTVFMKESSLAFLPISAGAAPVLLAMGNEIWGMMLVLLLSTILPLWAFARLTERGLKENHPDA